VQKVNRLNEDVDRWVCCGYTNNQYNQHNHYDHNNYYDQLKPLKKTKKCLPGGPASVQIFFCLAPTENADAFSVAQKWSLLVENMRTLSAYNLQISG
jgi:hypothetical protein